MSDSFFEFNTTLPDDDGGGPLDDLSEEDYDALNDETFGAARDDDWENVHENLVKLEKEKNGSTKDDDSDLDINFTNFNLADFDLSMDDTDAKIQLDPSVWAALPKPKPLESPSFFPPAPRMSAATQPQQHQQHPGTPQSTMSMNIFAQLMKQAVAPAPIKMCTVEELERNMLSQSKGKKDATTPVSDKKHAGPPHPRLPPNMSIAPPPGMAGMHPGNGGMFNQQLPGPPPSAAHLLNQPPMGPPPMGGAFNPVMMQRARNMPFPPFPPGSLPPPPPPGTAPPGGPMNNFGMGGHVPPQFHHRGPHPLPGGPHPGHGVMNVPPRAGGLPFGQQNLPPPPPHALPNMPTNVNQFNQRLVEEIQQNHPMLSFNRQPNQHNMMHRQQGQGIMQGQGQGGMHRQQQPQHQPNGNLKAEPQDPYANLMSNRDKQWLISIQLMQLHTDTPYFDDFYFTVFKERKAKVENRAHLSNTLNHPFTQGPKGHAHNMLLVSLTNKNGMNHHHNNKNGPFNNRERKNSESNENKEQRTHYTPLQFENSLGKLQVGCGSVTAPRKIIDMEVVATDPGICTPAEASVQRKTARQVLLHIETMFKIILRLEDLENPMAIAAAQIIKQKRAKEIQQALDQAAIARALAGDSGAGEPEDEVKISVPTDKYPEPETYEELIPRLMAGLVPDKVAAMMTVRKGRQLMRRCMPFLKKNPQRWTIWCGILSSLYVVFKKEKEIDGVLMGLYEEFERQLQYAKLEDVVLITHSLAAEKKTNALLSHKYTLSIIVALILQAETLFCNADYKRTVKDEETWQQFLKTLANAADGIKVHGPAIGPMDNQVLTTMIQHLTRFNSVQTKPLLNLLTQADSK